MNRPILFCLSTLLVMPLISSGGTIKSLAVEDSRLPALQRFFRLNGSPVESLAHEFLAAADQNGLDWRLLPSLAMIESAGGRVGGNNNIFGWGRVRFASIPEGIHAVARTLSEGLTYRGKTLDQKLKLYNPMGNYIHRVHKMMRRLGPAPKSEYGQRVDVKAAHDGPE